MTSAPTAQAHVHAPAALLLNAAQAAAVCGVSRSFWWLLHSSGRCPLPVFLGRRRLWRADELADWCAAGCPPRTRWAWGATR